MEQQIKHRFHNAAEAILAAVQLLVMRWQVGTNTAIVEEVGWVDSVPVDDHQTGEQLRERARKYIEAEYGHKENNENARIVGKYGHIFEMETCVDTNWYTKTHIFN